MDPRDARNKLGRVYVEDERDKDFPMSSVVPLMEESERHYRYWWDRGWWGDQGTMPHCVGFAWAHWIEDGPVTHEPKTPGAAPILKANEIYHRAQKLDRWPGESYAGTSVRAGAKVLQQEGLIEGYRWAWDVETICAALLEKGPVVVGTAWHWDMFEPDEDGFVTPTGGVAGGHAYVLNGVNLKKELIRAKNSWGRSWGDRGYFYLRFDDLAELLDDHGEACLAMEVPTDD